MKDKERVVVNYSDNSVGKMTGNQFYGNVGNIVIGNNNAVSDENRNMGSTNSHISDKEWIQLARYLFEKQMSSDDEDLQYQDEYEQAEKLTKKKDKEGLKKFFKTKGAALLKMLMNSATQVGIRMIVQKIMDSSVS